jgi:type II secretory pathway component PulK
MTHRASIARRCERRVRRGSVIVVVLWAVALGAIVVASLQLSAQRQAVLGSHAVERVQARWAARAGVERMIAILEYFTEEPDTEDAFRIYREMADASYVDDDLLLGATYAIEHYDEDRVWDGPFDEHKRLNINFAAENGKDMLANLRMDPQTIDSIVDWIDDDDEPSPEGVESSWYLSAGIPYQPRNRYMRHIAELELVAGADVRSNREEDWNLNNRFDANENDGLLTMPEDDANGLMEQGWAKYLTAHSVAGGLGASGLPRLYLREATAEEVRERTGVDANQAAALVAFGMNPNNTMPMLFQTPLPYVNADGSIAPFDGPFVNDSLPLDALQYMSVFSELTLDDPTFRLPGKININVASADVLRDVLNLDPVIADEIIYRRERTARGFTSLIELVGVSPNFTATTLTDIADVLDVTSNVFTITSTGRSATTGLEVQLIVVVDRSTLPVHILEYREQ